MFEKFARIFSRRHKQMTFSDAGFLDVLRVKGLDAFSSLHYENTPTVFTLSIRTPPHHTCSKIWTSTIYYPMLCLKIAEWVTNRVDLDETPRSAASHLGLHCLFRPVCLTIYCKTDFKYIENFTTKKGKFSDKNAYICHFFCSKHRLWICVRTTSARRF